METVSDLLRASTWTRSLSPAQLARVESEILVRDFPSGAFVVRKGDPVDHWIGIVDGLVKMTSVNPQGKTMTFTGVTSGGWFGEGSLLKDEIRKQGIRASLVEPGFTRTSFEDSMRNPDSPLPAYALARDAANKQMREGLDKGDSPELVANVVVKVANAKSPKLRYSAGKVSTQVSFIRRFVPEFVFDKIVRSANKLPA